MADSSNKSLGPLQIPPNAQDEVVRLNLDDLREQLIRQEETIIFALIERAQWAHNELMYKPGGLDVPMTYKNESFLDYFFSEIEKVHAYCRRYTSPDEHPFYPHRLPLPVLPLLNYKQTIKPNTVNINHKIMALYIEKILPAICTSSERDDNQYGSSSNADVQVLQALSKRIHYGKFVAEAKFQANPEQYSDLIQKRDTDGIMQLLTNAAVEEKLLARVKLKASTYGQEIEQTVQPNTYKLHPDVIVELYRNHIIPMTKEVQVGYLLERQGSSISFLGPEGTFSQQVAQQFFKNSTATSKVAQFVPCEDIKQVFVNVLSNKTIYGVIPIENSQTGIIHPHLNLIIDNDIVACAEQYLPISFDLMSNSKLDDITQIFSHPQGFQQCQGWLKTHVPSAALIPVASTAHGAEKASQEGVAVLGGPIVAQKYNLPILASNIQDSKENVTRFLIISKFFGEACGKDKTIITFGTKHVPGALSHILAVFEKEGINLTCIESYPERTKNFHYGFFVEFEGHMRDPKVSNVLASIKQHCEFVSVKGSYPSGVLQ